jgi:hypothetical protein
MRKAIGLSTAIGVLIVGATFVVLYPILGVALWIAFVATGGAMLSYSAGAVAALADGGANARRGESALSISPVLDVGVLRLRYAVTLALAIAGGFMVVESLAFSSGAMTAISFALGIGIVTLAGAFYVSRLGSPKQVIGMLRQRIQIPVWDVLAVVVGAIGAWNIVQSQVFGPMAVKWLTFADGLGLLGAALCGLIVHELSTERVVHALEVVAPSDGATVEERAQRRREAAHAS